MSYFCTMSGTWEAKHYLRYLATARSRYRIHSPFLFQLIEDVFRDKTRYPDYQTLKQLKKELLNDRSVIEVTDLGAGSRVSSSPIRSVSSITKNTTKTPRMLRLIYRFVRYFKPFNIIELGTSVGLTSAAMALANPEGNVYTVEGCPNIANRARKNFDQLRLTNITAITGSFDEKLSEILKATGTVHLAFVDGNHRYEPTLEYFKLLAGASCNETILIFDDIYWSPEMTRAWEEISNDPAITLSLDLFHLGILFFRKELSPERIVLRF